MRLARLVLACLLLLEFSYAPLGAQTLPYSLVDKDAYSIFEEEQQAKREAELTLEDPMDDAQLLHYSNEYWRQAVTSVDGAYELDKGPEPIPDLTLLNPTLSLPIYGTSIALTGRYVLGAKLAGKRYKSDPNSNVSNRNAHSTQMDQQLQLKMQGKILDRVFLDIDYDDKREDEKTLSVAYRGKPGELIQLAEFGDINLSLPGGEFITYDKQLFGAKMHLQHKNANLYVIGSQTKGSSKQKRFVGSSVSEIISVDDIAYQRRTYYDLTFGGNVRPYTTYPAIDTTANADWEAHIGAISPGTEEIYLDSNTTATDYVPVYKTATDYLGGGDYEAKWQLLTRGVDYTIDYAKGYITFKRSITAASVLAVDYVGTNGTRLSDLGTPNTIKFIKTANDSPVTSAGTETANKLELKTFYSIGAQKITQDNGKGNFILQLLDANGNVITDPNYTYPAHINVDFDSGIFDLDYGLNDPGVYGATPTSSLNQTFRVQYQSTVKTYFIEAGIVVQSETVKLNGATLKRNNDYYIDYTSGFITFYKGELITENSVIDITYDTTAGSDTNTSVLGGRLDYKLFDKVMLGASVIKEGGDKPSTVPQVGQYSKDLLVYGADINGKDITLAAPLHMDFSVEAAHSEKHQNLYGYAMVDSMNDTSAQVAGSRVFREWQIAANPSGQQNFLDAIHWDTQDLPALEINPNSIASYNDKQQVLVLDYDFTKGDAYGRDEVSIVYPISQSGVDLSEKTSFELTLLGETDGPQVNFTFGNINEDSDFSGGMTTDCGSGVPKTEDIYCRNSLAPSEDIGWLYTNPDGTQERYNPFAHNEFNYESQPNGRIDTQDLNGNGKFDDEKIPTDGNFGYGGGNNIPGMAGSVADNTTWKTYSVPVTFLDKKEWTAIRHLRITLKKGGKLKGRIKIANVSLSGTSWNPNTSESSVFSISGINNVDNHYYQPIFSDRTGDGQSVFNYLYGSLQNYKDTTDSSNALDQALRLKFDTSSSSFDSACTDGECYANRNFSSMDFTQHRQFRFLLHGAVQPGTDTPLNQDGTEFFLKIGTGQNYSKIIVPTNFENWHLISLELVDSNGDGVPDALRDLSDPSYGVRVKTEGTLNFREISLVLAGVQRQEGQSGSAGEVWLNVLHLAEAVKLEGDAYKGQVDLKLDDWGTAGARYVHKDSNFETPLSISKQQETTEEEYYLKVNRIKEFPMSANLTRSSVTTPLVTDTTDYNTVSLLDKGEVKRQRAVVRGDFIKEKYPNIGVEYTQDSTDYQLMKRQDETRSYGVTLTHNTQRFKNITAGYHYIDSQVEYDTVRQLESTTYYDTQENTQKFNVKATFQPSNNFQLTPSYNLSKSREDRSHVTDGSLHYPKALNQSTGFNSTWKIARWLAPSLSYNISTVEANNLSDKKSLSGQNIGIGQVKTINRNADGGISLTLNGNEILPKSKLLNTLVVSTSYRIQDADSWLDMDSGYDSRKALWIRGGGLNGGAYGYRRSLILRDTFTTTQRWNPFSQYNLTGAAAPLKTLSLINNFSKTMQNNEQTGTVYDSTSRTLPDLTVSISDLEKMVSAGRWLGASNLKLRYSQIEQTNLGTDERVATQYGGDLRFMLFNYFDTVFNYTHQNVDKTDLRARASLEQVKDHDLSAQTSFYVKSMRITPKLLYSSHEKRAALGRMSESSTAWTPSLNLRWDFNIPRGFKMPFFNKIYKTTNRVIWNTTLSYTHKKSQVEVKDNYQLFDLMSSLDYEFSQNLRFTLSGGLTLMQHAYVESEDYTAYNVAANVTVQF